MKYLSILFPLILSACAIQTSPGSNDSGGDQQMTAATPELSSGDNYHGNLCAPELVIIVDGKEYYRPGYCALPGEYEPDPAHNVLAEPVLGNDPQLTAPKPLSKTSN